MADHPFQKIYTPREPWSNRSVQNRRGGVHKFMLIPIMMHHTRWFDAGPVSIGVEARALGSPSRIIRGPSIHVCDSAHDKEFLRFDIFGSVPHYHYILNEPEHNVMWDYDQDTCGPMLPWAVAAIRNRLPTMLRTAGEPELAASIEECGWNVGILEEVERACAEAFIPRENEGMLAQEGTDWMYAWKKVHPQFNTVEEGEY